jgi:hypothetical protein
LSKLMRQKQDENVQDAIFGFDKKDWNWNQKKYLKIFITF